MSRLTLEEKRKQTLHRQLYGVKNDLAKSLINKQIQKTSQTFKLNPLSSIKTTDLQDAVFLKSELFKITILTAGALAIQAILLILQMNKLWIFK